ncbi:MAG: MFS transporter, partial [Pseudomonadota bacterium]
TGLIALFSLLPLPVPVLAPLVVVWSATGWAFMAPQQIRLLGRQNTGQAVTLALNAAAIYVGAAIGSALGAGVMSAAGIGWLGLAGSAVCALALMHLVLGDRLAAGRDG